jgi:NADH-quinone oxidoreductase subunit A
MTNLFYLESGKIGFFLILCILLVGIIMFISYLFSITLPDTEKLSAYECGFDPFEDARNVFDVKFYLVAILFIIFDLEAVYFFPWCVSISYLSEGASLAMLDFLIELLVGYLYAWEVGAFDWD